jgi:hypothetical protein
MRCHEMCSMVMYSHKCIALDWSLLKNFRYVALDWTNFCNGPAISQIHRFGLSSCVKWRYIVADIALDWSHLYSDAKYMCVTCPQNVKQNRSIKIANKSLENVAKLKYFGTTITDQKCIVTNRKFNLLTAIQPGILSLLCYIKGNVPLLN